MGDEILYFYGRYCFVLLVDFVIVFMFKDIIVISI